MHGSGRYSRHTRSLESADGSLRGSAGSLPRASGAGAAEGAACEAGTHFGELSEELVQGATGQRDLASITKFAWCNKALANIRGLERCTGLLELDLTGNNIASLSGLSALCQLRKLAVSRNRIERINGLPSLRHLQHLLIQANSIVTLESVNLAGLQALPALQSLYLRNFDGSEANPVCRRLEYKRKVLAALPDLKNLDGERNPMRGVYVHDDEDAGAGVIPRAVYNPDFSFPEPAPWFKASDFVVPELHTDTYTVALQRRLEAMAARVDGLETEIKSMSPVVAARVA